MDSGRNLSGVCQSFRARLKGLLLWAGLARIVLLAVLLMAALLLIDWWAHLGAGLRVATLLLYLAALAATLWFTLIGPIRGRWTDREVLSYVDSVLPRGQGMLLDLHELTETPQRIQETDSPVGRSLVESAVRQLSGLVARVRLADTLYRRRLGAWLFGAAVAVMALAIFGLALPNYLRAGVTRLFNPFSEARWPHVTALEGLCVQIGEETFPADRKDLAVPQLEPMTVKAEVTGVIPRTATMHYRIEGRGDWDKVQLLVTESRQVRQVDGQEQTVTTYNVSHTFESVGEPIRFYLLANDYDTREFNVGIIERPHLTRVVANYRFPRYAGIPDRTEETRQLKALEGTEVEVVFESSMGLKSAELVQDQTGQVTRFDLDGGRTFRHTLPLVADTSYDILLHEEHGFKQARPERLDVQVIPDKPPTVELLSPGRDLVQTNRASVPVSLRVSDDFGLSKVQFLFHMDEGQPEVLTDRITGDIPQGGAQVDWQFDWPLRKSELPEAGTLYCYVIAQDNKPSGRGPVESIRGQVKLVKPTDFHLEILEQSKALLAEARLAWLNQYEAYWAGQTYLKEGTGGEEDPAWSQMHDQQDRAFLAAKAMRRHMQWLTDQYTRNQMGREFMSVRLGRIAELINRVTDSEHGVIEAGLRDARPKTIIDAAPQRLLALRKDSLGKFQDNQKLSVLALERTLRLLYDWRDLQVSAVTAKLMIDQQADVIKETQDIALVTVGQDILDLPESVQDKLLTLGKKQQVIYDTETGLERALQDQILKAERQQRQTILKPLYAAFKILRDERVNDNLKLAAQMLQINQPAQVLGNQKAAIAALRLVEAGLVAAGQDVDDMTELALGMSIGDRAGVDPEAPVAQAPVGDDPTTQPDQDLANLDLPELDRWVAETGSALSNAIRTSLEAQDDVLARTRYLSDNNSAEEMPRFVRLKQIMLVERQAIAVGRLAAAAAEAEKTGPEPVKGVLAVEKVEFEQFARLAADKDVTGTHQQAQTDSIAALNDLLQLLALDKKVADSAAENKRQGGVDAFGREFLLRDANLDTAVALLADTNHAHLLQKDVVRKLSRFADKERQPKPGTLLAGLETENVQRAAKLQQQVAELVAAVTARAASLSGEPAERVSGCGVGTLGGMKLADYVAPIAAGKADPGTIAALSAAEQELNRTVQDLWDLLEERVKPPVIAAGTEVEPPKMTQEEFERLTSRQHIAEMLTKDDRLSPQVRERMIRALSRDFPAKYRDLLAAYYGSFVPAEAESGTSTTQPDEDKAAPTPPAGPGGAAGPGGP